MSPDCQKRTEVQLPALLYDSGVKKSSEGELGGYLDASREAMEAESAKPIRQAQQYVDEHYGEKIVLEDLADIVGLNPVYFSVLFKKRQESISAHILSISAWRKPRK